MNIDRGRDNFEHSGDVLQYDEYTQKFEVIGELNKNRSWHSMTVVSKDQFLCL